MNNYFPPVYYTPFSHPHNLSPAQFLEFSKIVSDGFKKIPSKEDIEKYFLIINKISDDFIVKETIYDEALRIRVIIEILKQKSDITAEDIDNIAAQYVNILRSENPDIDNEKIIEYISTIAHTIDSGLVKTKLCIYAVFVSALLKNKELD